MAQTAWQLKVYMFIDVLRIDQAKAATRETFLAANPNATQAELDNEAAYWDMYASRWLHPPSGTVVMGAEFPATPGMRQTWRDVFVRGDLDSGGAASKRGRFMAVHQATRVLQVATHTNFPAGAGAVVGQAYTFEQAAAMLGLTRIIPVDE